MRSWLANLLGVGTAGAALGLGLVVGAPEAAANGPSNAVHLAAPPASDEAATEVSLGDSMELWGRPSRLTMFWTADESSEIIRTYLEAWKDVHSQPVVRRLDRVTSASVLEPETGLMRSVSVTDVGDQRLVVPSLTDVRAFPDLGARHAPVPVPENAKAYLSQVADDSSSVSYHATFLIPISPARAVEFYKVELGKLGYASRDPLAKSSVHAQTAEFSRGPESVSVVATPTEDKSPDTAFVVVQHTRAIVTEGE